MAGHFNHTTPFFTSNSGKLFILMLANNPYSPPSFTPSAIYSFTSSPVPHLSLPSCSSPQPIYISLFAPRLSPCFHSVTPRATKFKSLSAAHSLIPSHSLHLCAHCRLTLSQSERFLRQTLRSQCRYTTE